MALLWASRQLASVKEKCENMDQKIGVEIIERACRAPLKAIANNAVSSSFHDVHAIDSWTRQMPSPNINISFVYHTALNRASRAV